MAGRRVRVAMAVAVALIGGSALSTALPAGADPGGIVISELNYHAGSDLDADDFLELTNTSSSAIDVSGWSFSAGVTATFAPGTVIPGHGYFVVAKDAAQFQTTYGFAPDATYGGNLSNGGEEVTLVDAGLATIDTVTYADADPWPGTPDGTGPSLELRDLSADNTRPEAWGPSIGNGGTPRAANSIAGTGPAPTVSELVATPARPNPNQAIVVSARLTAGSTANLTYKVMFGADIVLPMRDDAASPGGAGDGVYAATIPGQAAGRLVRYRVDAVSDGTAYALPVVGDSIRYRGIVVLNPAVSTQLPTIEWFMDDAVYNDILANHRFDDYQGAAVWTYNGQVWDNTLMNVRGNSSRSNAKVSWKVELPKGYTFDLGGQLPYPLDEFALQNEADNFADVGWATVKAAGARGLSIIPVRTQRNGNFWSLGRIMETEDGSWREAQGVKDWSIYKGDGGSVGRTSSPAALEASLWLDKKTREDEDFTDAWTLSNTVDASPSASQLAWIYRNVNIPELINYMAINSIIRHQDSGWYNWWIARDTEGTGRWDMWHWDLNWIFTTPASDGKGLFLTPDTSNRFTRAMLAYPEFLQMFYRRLRTLADQFLAPGRYEAQWDAISAKTTPDWNLDRAAWGGYTPSSARNAFLAGLADRRNAINGNTGAGKPVPTSQSANAAVTITEVADRTTAAGGASIQLTNPGSTAVDVSGWTIPSVGLTIQAGTVVPAGGRIWFVADDVAFTAAGGSTNRLVGGEFPGTLTGAGPTITLLDGTRVVASAANPAGNGNPTTTTTTTTTSTTTSTTSTSTTSTTTTTTTAPTTTTTTIPGGPSTAVAFPFGSTWRYLDTRVDQGTAWRSTTFSDSGWPQGAGQFGFGDGDETTVLAQGPDSDRIMTAYFRRTFDVSNPAQVTTAVLDLIRDDGAVVYVNGTEVARSNMPSGAINYNSYASSSLSGSAEANPVAITIPPSALRAGTNTIAVEVHQNYHASSDLSFDARLTLTSTGGSATTTTSSTTTTTAPTTTTTVPGGGPSVAFPFGATWRYLDTRVDQGTAWRSTTFSDSGWPQGAGQFGFGDGDETTVLAQGPDSDRIMTAYFRRTFDVTNAAQVSGAVLELIRDDGAVVYVNGTEVARSNMPSGAINYNSYASSNLSGAAERDPVLVTIPASVLRSGSNTIAVEVHQNYHASSDLSFDARLTLNG